MEQDGFRSGTRAAADPAAASRGQAPRARELESSVLRRRCDPDALGFATTSELEALDGAVGQARALEALRFGVHMRSDGYNLFVLGPPGTGRHHMVRHYLEQQAAGQPVPPDWVYVNHFADPRRPRALRLPPGRGRSLAKDMDTLIEELRAAIPAAFESEEYRTRREALVSEFKDQQEEHLAELGRKVAAKGALLVHTPTGLTIAPAKEGRVLTSAEFEQLPPEERDRIGEELEALSDELRAFVRRIPQWDHERRGKERELDREVVRHAVGHLIDELRRRWSDQQGVCAYLDEVRDDVLETADEFRATDAEDGLPFLAFAGPPTKARDPFRRYRVNVLVEHGDARGAPVVFEGRAGHDDLLGRVEHVAHMGTLVTDFTLVRAGALHRASGGYLVLDARKVLMQPFAWEDLKRCLRSGEVRIESLGEQFSLTSTVGLEPEPIPLDVKVVLVGEPLLYYLLSALDEDFPELFKVPVDLDDRTDRTDGAARLYARLLAATTHRHGLRAMTCGAVARVVEEMSRLAGDATKLSTRIASLVDLAREADFWAGQVGRQIVEAEDVERALAAQERRRDRLRERVHEELERGMLMVDVDGAAVGQVNGLSLVDLGGFRFGRPTRITARVRLGKGEVVDIEREVELGGPIHSKGVLILSGFLGARYLRGRPLAFAASLVFEQSYGGVEGDSASSAELYALLSALAEAPLRQDLAVTGSVNQHGFVQPVGGIDEKVEGFFDACRRRGLTGRQGVLVPAANAGQLMLRRDVVDAVARGAFHVYAVAHVDEGIELLTGLAAGERDEHDAFPAGTLNRRVEDRLDDLAERARDFLSNSIEGGL